MRQITKNLMFSVATVVIAALTCVGVTFAYFSSDYRGSDNNIVAGSFEFSTLTTLTANKDILLKAPTIINVPQMQPDNALFNSDGDDTFFNDMVTPFDVTATNMSATDMSFYASIAATGTGNTDYTAHGAFQYFIFDSYYTSVLKGDIISATVASGDYAAAIREISVKEMSPLASPLYLPPIVSPNGMDGTFLATHTALNAGRGNSKLNMQKTLTPKTQVTDGVSSYSKSQLLSVCWLDYRGYKKVAGIDRPSGLVTIKLTVTAEQFMY